MRWLVQSHWQSGRGGRTRTREHDSQLKSKMGAAISHVHVARYLMLSDHEGGSFRAARPVQLGLLWEREHHALSRRWLGSKRGRRFMMRDRRMQVAVAAGIE